jgi:hypothetical protein
MPKVTEAERQRRRDVALAWINSKWTASKSCPICASNNWTMTDVYEWREYAGGDLLLSAPSPLFPVWGLVCSVCGFTHTFNAVITGVIEANSTTPPKPETSESSEGAANG